MIRLDSSDIHSMSIRLLALAAGEMQQVIARLREENEFLRKRLKLAGRRGIGRQEKA